MFGEIFGWYNWWGWLPGIPENSLGYKGQPPAARDGPAQGVHRAEAETSYAQCHLKRACSVGVGVRRERHVKSKGPSLEQMLMPGGCFCFQRGGGTPKLIAPQSLKRCVWEERPPRAGGGRRALLVLLEPFVPRFCLGTAVDGWVGDAITLNKPNAAIKWNLEAFNYLCISIL